MRLPAGEIIGGKYRIVRLIGDGGMGAVYEAHHQLLDTKVALKFLHPELVKRSGLATRFLQEARVSARIQSPHVTRVTDVDQTPEGSPFIVMELLSGEGLQQLLDRRPKLPRDQAIDFALQILSGLEAAHALGVVHRDLKPDNVFITPSGGGPVLKLLDFGIAKLRDTNEYKKGLTRPGAVMGTPEYMAPEQLYAADQVDHRADLFSLGVMLYEMLSGERPAYGDDAASIIGKLAQGKLKRLTEHDADLGEELESVVHKAFAPEKDGRFASALEMRLALAPFAGQLSHAGRLAATPVPNPVSEAPGERGSTTDLKPLSQVPHPKGGVAPTLPPEDDDTVPAQTAPEADAPKGATQEASKELLQQLTGQLKATEHPPGPHQPAAHDARPYPAAAPPGPSPGAYGPPQPQPVRKRKSGLGALLALLLGLAVTGAVVLVIVMVRDRRTPDPPPINPLGEPTGTATVTAEATGTTAPLATPPSPTETSGTTPPPGPGPVGPRPTATGQPKADAGAKPDGGTTAPFPTFPPLPSSLPPMPSGFPPIPTTLPTIPGFPPPGQQPPK